MSNGEGNLRRISLSTCAHVVLLATTTTTRTTTTIIHDDDGNVKLSVVGQFAATIHLPTPPPHPIPLNYSN